jgi:hypothetical protein
VEGGRTEKREVEQGPLARNVSPLLRSAGPGSGRRLNNHLAIVSDMRRRRRRPRRGNGEGGGGQRNEATERQRVFFPLRVEKREEAGEKKRGRSLFYLRGRSTSSPPKSAPQISKEKSEWAAAAGEKL